MPPRGPPGSRKKYMRENQYGTVMDAGDTEDKGLDTTVVAIEDFSFDHLRENLEYAFPSSYNRKIMDYFAFYRKSPVSAVTHYAPVTKVIEDAEIPGKYRLMAFGDNAREKAVKVVFGDLLELDDPVVHAGRSTIQGIYYTKLEYLKKAENTEELFSLKEK